LKPKKILEKIRSYLQLIRARNCAIAFIGVLVGASLAQPHLDILSHQGVLLAATAAFLIVGGGNAINDYFDYEIDKTNKPRRPIPSGRVSRSDAFMLSIVMFLVGVWLAHSINRYAFLLAVSRAIGETMIVVMATGNTAITDWTIFNGFRALSANIAVEIPEAPYGGSHYRVLFVAALVLFVMTFLVNTFAEIVRMHLRSKLKGL